MNAPAPIFATLAFAAIALLLVSGAKARSSSRQPQDIAGVALSLVLLVAAVALLFPGA